MGRSLEVDFDVYSEETYNLLFQMKKLKPPELKNLLEALVNNLTIPSKEGLVYLIWEGLEPYERDLFNFPSNDIYSESIKDRYLEIFQHNQPLSSIWNNNDLIGRSSSRRRRNRLRHRHNRYIFSDEEDSENSDSRRRRRLDFNSIIDQLFESTNTNNNINTRNDMNITPDNWSSLSSRIASPSVTIPILFLIYRELERPLLPPP
ncbi:hypothetical protein LY90DRAFT_502553 [Neocallimastix californiae]|uniref:Uncharacterized protein n=1 Tax=Neocallimastix californiae TaxID=1754190 RepID=A0A1Y2ETB4_9FUNG|nr:hypothetical protein LY90DRAFT_502553 [Neocallimastix californiae]|eukprot:ORY74406.1 hypothetical protein LY90DRAFT_502553 [Neocallimastix californiae]